MKWTSATNWYPKYKSSKLTAIRVLRVVQSAEPNYGWWTAVRVSEHAFVGKRTADRCLSYWTRRGYLEYRRYYGYRIK